MLFLFSAVLNSMDAFYRLALLMYLASSLIFEEKIAKTSPVRDRLGLSLRTLMLRGGVTGPRTCLHTDRTRMVSSTLTLMPSEDNLASYKACSKPCSKPCRLVARLVTACCVLL